MAFYDYKLSRCLLHDSVFSASLFDTGKLKSLCLCVCACLLYHLFRKMAIYTEFDHLLVVVVLVLVVVVNWWPFDFSLFIFFFCFNYKFSGEWSSVNWSNLRKMADKWKVWKTFKKIVVIIEWLLFFSIFRIRDNGQFGLFRSESHLRSL